VAKVGAGQIRAAQGGSVKRSARYIEVGEIEEVELDIFDLGFGQRSVGQPCSLQDGPRQVGAVELCSAEVRAAQVGLRKVDAAKVEPRQLGVDEIRCEGRVGGAPLVPLAGAQLVEMFGVGHAVSLLIRGCGLHYTAYPSTTCRGQIQARHLAWARASLEPNPASPHYS
jgi:hypothetical protein